MASGSYLPKAVKQVLIPKHDGTLKVNEGKGKRQPPFKPRSQKFDFLGYTFKPRVEKKGEKFRLGFSPSISQKSQKRMAYEFYKFKIHRMVHLPLEKFAIILWAKRRGWINYFGKYRKSDMRKVFSVLNMRLSRDTQQVPQVQEEALVFQVQAVKENLQ